MSGKVETSVAMDEKDTSIVANHWGVAPPEPNSPNCFYYFPPVRDYLYECVTGKTGTTEEDWCERWTVETYLRDRIPVDECLSLCCGFGYIERRLARLGVFRHCTGMDLSPRAIQSATAKAREEGYDNVDYKGTDLNAIKLEPEKYDLIWANSALHHITNLEHVVSEIHKALKPGGILVANEYVGPKHMKLPFRQREVINSVIHLIPPEYRVTEDTFVPVYFRYPLWKRTLFELYKLLTFQPGSFLDSESLKPRPHWPRYLNWLLGSYEKVRSVVPVRKRSAFRYGKVWDEPSKFLELTDPSESVRAHDVIPVLRSKFRSINVRYFNGSVLLYALDQKFYRNFDPASERDRALVHLLISIEKTMIDIGEISSDHAHIVAKKEL